MVSNKGGVGKSTISVNMAVALAKRHPDRVLLVDVSLHLGSCAPMLDLDPRTNLATVARECERLDETLLRKLAVRHECGLHVLAAPIDAVEASEIDDENLSRILAIARRTYDWVIVDTFPMLDGLVMAILDLSDRAYVIVQNAVPNVHGAAHYLPVIGHIGFPRERVRVVLNNNFQRCAGTLRTKDVEERLGREVHHVVPYQKKLITALNTGAALRAALRLDVRVFGKAIRRIVVELDGLREESATTAIRGSRTRPRPSMPTSPAPVPPRPSP
ncbi:MAG: AAA family ATPase [Planctomycetota bacterium]